MHMATTALQNACALKTQIPTAEFAVTAGTKDAYYKLILDNVIITSISTSISAGETHPSESFTISFRKARWEYGSAKGGYDLAKNEKV